MVARDGVPQKLKPPSLGTRETVTWPGATSVHPSLVISSRYGSVPMTAGRPPTPPLLRLLLLLSLRHKKRGSSTLTAPPIQYCATQSRVLAGYMAGTYGDS